MISNLMYKTILIRAIKWREEKKIDGSSKNSTNKKDAKYEKDLDIIWDVKGSFNLWKYNFISF